VVRVEQGGKGDYRTLEEAVDGAPPGATIRLGAGEFLLRAPLNLNRSITLVGDGVDRTRITCKTGDVVVSSRGGHAFAAADLTFAHQGSAPAVTRRTVAARLAGELQAAGPTDVVLLTDAHVDLRRCRFEGATMQLGSSGSRDQIRGRGLTLAGRTTGDVVGCVATGNAWGILVSGTASPTIVDTICAENSITGLTYDGQAHGVARGNTCNDNRNNGIELFEEASPQLEGNICRHNGHDGISFNGSTSGTSQGNSCIANQSSGISLHQDAHPLLSNNNCRENQRSGIRFIGTRQGKAYNNICTLNRTNGIEVSDQASAELLENTCRSNKECGIHYSASDGVARSNICETNAAGIAIDGEGRVIIEANTCSENTYAGISLGSEARPIVTKNRCLNNKQYGVSIMSEDPRATIQSNVCTHNLKDGIVVDQGASPTLERNSCSDNDGSGIAYNDKSGAGGRSVANVCERNARSGVLVAGHAKPTLDQNTYSENRGHGIEVTGASSPTLTHNICKANRGSGISYTRDPDPGYLAETGSATANSCIANMGDGITVSRRAAPLLLDNVCEENGGFGLRFLDHSGGDARGNRIKNNRAGEIFTSDWARPTLDQRLTEGNRAAEADGREESTMSRLARWFGLRS
jgi:parallel beta-helix repeat protein